MSRAFLIKIEKEDDRNTKVDVSLEIHQMNIESYQQRQTEVNDEKLVKIVPVFEERFSE